MVESNIFSFLQVKQIITPIKKQQAKNEMFLNEK